MLFQNGYLTSSRNIGVVACFTLSLTTLLLINKVKYQMLFNRTIIFNSMSASTFFHDFTCCCFITA